MRQRYSSDEAKAQLYKSISSLIDAAVPALKALSQMTELEAKKNKEKYDKAKAKEKQEG